MDQQLNTSASRLDQAAQRTLSGLSKAFPGKAVKEHSPLSSDQVSSQEAIHILEQKATDRGNFKDQLRQLPTRRVTSGDTHASAVDDDLRAQARLREPRSTSEAVKTHAPSSTTPSGSAARMQPSGDSRDGSGIASSTHRHTSSSIGSRQATVNHDPTRPAHTLKQGLQQAGTASMSAAVHSAGQYGQSGPRMPTASDPRPGSRGNETYALPDHPTPVHQQPQRHASTSQFNPVFGQEDSHSPAHPHKSHREYTPSLTSEMTAVRMRAPVTPPAAQLKSTGDLFSIHGPQLDLASNDTVVVKDMLSSLPAWNTARPHLTGMDLVLRAAERQAASETYGGPQQPPADMLERLPHHAQEVAVMNDLLYAFMGVDGVHVYSTLLFPDGPGTTPCLTFTMKTTLLACSQELLRRLLPLCEYVAVLQRFIETRSVYHYGLVNHALCAAIRRMLSDWQLVVTQLEHLLRTGRLSVQALVFYCQGPLASLGLLAGLAAEAADQQLGSSGLLNLLAAKASALSGDAAGKALLQQLLHAATVPYFKILERWLCEGVLDDPYGDFMIQENQAVSTDALTPDSTLAYWSHRYTIRMHQPPGQAAPQPDVPVFLQGVVDEILTTGKYLNAIRACGQSVRRPLPTATHLTYDPQHSYISAIHTAHASASRALLELMTEQQDMHGWLRSLKHFFLLDQGDVVVHLAEAARAELSGPASSLSRPRLQSLLELALKTSSLAQDPHADALVLELEPRHMLELARAAGALKPPPTGTQAATPSSMRLGLSGVRRGEEVAGWELVQLSVRVSWPLSLVLSPRAMAQYQLIFRWLFQLKHAEQQLALAWHRMQAVRRAAKQQRTSQRPVHVLAQHHLFVIQELLRYSSVDILEPAWQHMEDRLRKAVDVDQVIKCHDHFLCHALDGLFLSYPHLLRPLVALQQAAIQFAASVVRAWNEVNTPRQSESGSLSARAAGRVSTQGAAADAAGTANMGLLDIKSLSHTFSSGLNELLSGLQDLYAQAMRREAGVSTTQPQSLETREEVEALLGLIQRLQLPGAVNTQPASQQQAAPGTGPGGSGVPPAAKTSAATNTAIQQGMSTASMYKQLQARAVALK